jgi:hypothetical protein
MIQMMNYWFADEDSGEEFFVQEDDKDKAIRIAKEYFNQPILIDIVDDPTAEMAGLDTY